MSNPLRFEDQTPEPQANQQLQTRKNNPGGIPRESQNPSLSESTDTFPLPRPEPENKPRRLTRLPGKDKVPANYQGFAAKFAMISAAYFDAYDRGCKGDPASYKEATRRKERLEWALTMDREFEFLNEINTWKLVTRPENVEVLKRRWVYKTRRDPAGRVVRYKAR